MIRLMSAHPDYKAEVERSEQRMQGAVAREMERTLDMEAPGDVTTEMPRPEGAPAAQGPKESGGEGVDQHSCRNPVRIDTSGEGAHSTSSARRARPPGGDEL